MNKEEAKKKNVISTSMYRNKNFQMAKILEL